MKNSLQKFSNLVLVSLVLMAGETSSAKIIDRTAVAVNDEVILESDIDAFQKKLQSKSFQELFGGIDPSAFKNRNSVLQLLVEEKIINQQVKKLDLQVSDAEVDAQIRTIVKRNGITQDQLASRLKQLGTTLSEYRDGIRRQLERRNLIDREIKPSLEVTEEQLRHYYLQHGGGNAADTQYHLAHILVATAGKSVGSAADRAKAIHDLVVKAPQEFDKIVKEYSDDSSTANTGGDLGLLAGSSLSKEFKAAVSKLEVGKVSPPVKTAAGFHILKLIDTKSSDFANLPKEKKDEIRMEMSNQEVEKKMLLWIERKKAEAHITKLGN